MTTQFTDADGVKIVEGNVRFLVQPSRDYLRREAQNTLRSRSTTVDTATFPQGRWERVNDYDSRIRTFQEFDAEVGGSLVNTELERIPNEEVAEQTNQDEWTGLLTDLEAIGTVADARNVLRRMSRYISRRDAPDTPVPQAVIFASDVMNRVGQTVNVPVVMELVPPSGLAGYDLQAGILDPSVARFVDVVFPAAFSLNSHTPDPVSGNRLTSISGVDLGDAITGGETNLTLCTLRVELLTVGSTTLAFGRNAVDDDGGFPIDILTRTPTITVA